ncbi:MAG: hypothetical protein CMP21_08740 [Rickettsiales bacterium]|nr:hypothetical protein [Rickettsiales bacterium]
MILKLRRLVSLAARLVFVSNVKSLQQTVGEMAEINCVRSVGTNSGGLFYYPTKGIGAPAPAPIGKELFLRYTGYYGT